METAEDSAEKGATANRHDENPYAPPATIDSAVVEPFALPLGVLAMLVVIGLFLIPPLLVLIAALSITV